MYANSGNPLIRGGQNIIQHYNHEKYWKMREEVVNPYSKLPKLIRIYYLFRIKEMDAFNNATMGTDLGKGAFFANPPILPHGLNGIIISPFAKIGENCTIFHQVTVAQDHNGRAATIGDHCMIGAGAKIMGDVKIGNHVKIGANAVVVNDLPDHCTAVGVPARVIANK
jgi:serine acetyltransferase